jgi:SAM-dependent methyltransferase
MVKKRFSPEQIKSLLALRWWDWDKEDIARSLSVLCSPNIERFLEEFKQEGGPIMDRAHITSCIHRGSVPAKIFLHVGCGPKNKDQTTRVFAQDDWQELRLDIDPAARPDIVGTMLDMPAVASASVDAVFSSHNIEHLYPHEVPVALKEFLRVLRPDGLLVVTCPDLQGVARLIADDKLTETAYTAPAGPIAPLDILYGHRPQLAAGNLYMAHHCGFTLKVLLTTLKAAGFAAVAGRQRASFFDLWAVAAKNPLPDEELRKLAGQHFPM